MRNITTLEAMMESPHEHGLPTFDEFAKNKEKYMGRADDNLASVDLGATGELKKPVTEYGYEVHGYRCDTLEEVERVASSQGIPLRELDYVPIVIPQGAGKWKAIVKFMSRDEVRERQERLVGRRRALRMAQA